MEGVGVADERHPRVASLAAMRQFTFCLPLRGFKKRYWKVVGTGALDGPW